MVELIRAGVLRGESPRALFGALIFALLVSGCSGSGGDKTDELTSPVVSPSGASAGDVWDASEWVPTVKVTPMVMSEEEKLAFREQWLAQEARSWGLENPPHIELVRWTTVGPDYGETVGPCLEEAGFDVLFDGRSGFHFPEGVPESQEPALNAALYRCQAMYTVNPVYTQEWTDDQLRVLFDYWDEFYIPCLVAHGVEFDVTDRPSREAWVSGFYDAEASTWWPDGPLQMLGPQRNAELSAVCAEFPPNAAFFGTAQ